MTDETNSSADDVAEEKRQEERRSPPRQDPVAARPPPEPQVESKRKLRRRRRGRIACLFGMLLGFAGLIAGRLGVLWIHFDVFAQFTLHFAVIVLAFLIGYFMPRARVLTAVTIFILAVVAIGLWPHLASGSTGMATSPGQSQHALRFMTFNTRLSNHNADAVAEEVLRQDPDVAVLVEFGEEKRGALEKLKSRYPYQADCFRIGYCYIVMVSKTPFTGIESHSNWEGPPLMRAIFGPEFGNLTVVGIHTLRFPHQRAQLRQIDELVRFLDQIPGPQIVAGDFNSTPYSRILSSFGERSRMTRLTFLPTWPAQLQLPQLAIDHVFIANGVGEAEAPRIGSSAGSDHYPVIVGLSIPSP